MKNFNFNIYPVRFFRLATSTLILTLIVNGCFSSGKKMNIKYDPPTPASTEQHPWRGEKLLNDPDHFQFVIITDRTGGNRPGIYEQAIARINLLQPEFVISVGDLIEGYTEDLALIEKQWQDFFGIVDKLQMPFFFVPGNHDISNDLMLLEWYRRFGSPYYHFIYKNVLFLCLNTEDPPHASLDPEQTTYLLNVLNKYKNVRWTVVLMHEPLWHYGGIKGYLPIEAALKNRPHTVFSGHYHHYLYSERDQAGHFILATSGGVSELRGSQFGEFDHIVWVTMTDKGPVIANLDINGILPADVVDDSTVKMVQSLRNGDWIKVDPVVCPATVFTELEAAIQLYNPADHPLKISANLKAQAGINFSPEKINLTLLPDSSASIPVVLHTGQPVVISDLSPVWLELTGSYAYSKDRQLSLPQKRELILDWQHKCPRALTVGDIDGKIDDWDSTLFISCQRPQYIQEDWDWHGMDDCWFKFATMYDRENLYLALEINDDQILVYPDDPEQKQDRIYIELDPDPGAGQSGEKIPIRANPEQTLKIAVSAGDDATNPVIKGAQIKAAFSYNRKIIAELAIPIHYIYNIEDKSPGSAFRLNIGIMDHDNPANTKPSVLWWRPKWDSVQNYAGSGIFNRK